MPWFTLYATDKKDNSTDTALVLDLWNCLAFRNVLLTLLSVYLIIHIPAWVWLLTVLGMGGYMFVTIPGAANLWLDPKKFPNIMKLT